MSEGNDVMYFTKSKALFTFLSSYIHVVNYHIAPTGSFYNMLVALKFIVKLFQLGLDKCMKFEVVIQSNMEGTVFWDVAPCLS